MNARGVSARLGRPLLVATLAILSIVVAAGIARSQPSSLDVAVHQLDDSGYPEVRLVVTVTDGSGRPLTGLRPDQFTITAGGEEIAHQDVQTVLDAGAGIDVVLALDVSGSMEGVPLQRAKEVSGQLIQQLSPGDTVAVVAFADDVVVAVDYTPDRDKAAAAIESLAAGGDTALYQTVADVSDLGAESEQSRRAVILLSDGQDTASPDSVSRGSSLQAAEASRVPFFTIGLGTDVDEAYLSELGGLTEAGFYPAPSPDDLPQLFETIATLLRTQYVVTIDGRGVPVDAPSLTIAAESEGRSGSGDRALPDGFFDPRVDLSGLPAEPIESPLSLQPEISARRDVAAVEYFVDGEHLHSAEAAPFALPLDPIDFAVGPHELRIVVTDVEGARGEAVTAIEIAQVPPRVDIVNAEEGAVVSGRLLLEIDVKSQAPLAGVEVMVDGEALEPDEQGRFVLDSAAFGEGSHSLVVRASDEAGGVVETGPLTLRLRPPSGGGGVPLPALAAIGLGAATIVAALWYWRRRRRRAGDEFVTPLPTPGPRPSAPESTAAEPGGEVHSRAARLTVTNGGKGQKAIRVATEPVTIGSDPSCAVVLSDAGGKVAPREVRGWLQNDRLMLHRLRRSRAVSEVEPAWAVLEDGDEFWVGPYRFVFELLKS